MSNLGTSFQLWDGSSHEAEDPLFEEAAPKRSADIVLDLQLLAVTNWF